MPVMESAERLCPRRKIGGPRSYAIMTIVARHGPALIGPAEGKWLVAWQYSNHSADAYTGDLVVLTEHGWTDMMSGLGGHEPRLLIPAVVGGP